MEATKGFNWDRGVNWPVGLPGLVTTTTAVRSVTALLSPSRSGFMPARSGTRTGSAFATPAKRVMKPKPGRLSTTSVPSRT